MDIADEDIDAAMLKMQPKCEDFSDSDSNHEKPEESFDVGAYVETQMMNGYSEGDNSNQGTNLDGTTKRNKKQIFDCMECDYVCHTRDALLQHIDTHFYIDEIPPAPKKRKRGKKKTKGKGKNKNKNANGRKLIKDIQCTLCSYMCSNPSRLKEHMAVHSDEKPFSCDQCDFRTKHKLCLKKHTENKHDSNLNSMRQPGQKPYQCQYCEHRCTSKVKLLTHLAMHTDTKLHECHVCDYKSALKDALNKHIKIHTKPLKCSLCSFRCAESQYLNQHMLEHSGAKPYACDKCDYRANSKTLLNSHLLVHSTEKPYACEYCTYATNRKQELTRHIEGKHLKITPPRRRGPKQPNIQRKQVKVLPLFVPQTVSQQPETQELGIIKHAGEKPYPCPHCDYKGVTKSKLLTHLTIHSEDKPIKCHLCDYKCALKDALNKHMRTHTKPIKCSQCSFRCAEKQYLNQHMLEHAGEKPFACDECDYKATSRTLLNSHLLVHSTEKPYACEYCPYATDRKQELTRHVARMHNEFKPAQRRPRGPRQPKIEGNEVMPIFVPQQGALGQLAIGQSKMQPYEVPPEAVLPPSSSLGHGTMGSGSMGHMGMAMPNMSQMTHMSLGGYQFPNNTHDHHLWNQHTIQQL
ncbi:unnamed protein product [Meganyctiphanes norvegica]|uniref:C2H2-type domain-containing protein n=1 Tax=Meganyctiphanes norvegica TaxID=48144 RepID=A0AAV2RSH0_MEGNR